MLNYDFIRQKSVESKIDSITIEREYWQLLFLAKRVDSKSVDKN